MDRTEVWRFFVEQLQESAFIKHHGTRQYELRKTRQEHLDDMMPNELTAGQRGLMEEILFEIIFFHDREGKLLYQQGMKDCVWLLKNWGVLTSI